jgi:hypothetical protein
MLFYLLFYFHMFPTGIHCIWCFTISISGETYIEPGVPYKVTCTVSDFLENRRTIYSASISNDDITDFVIIDLTTGGCIYRTPASFPSCQSSLCSCDMDGLATHWTYSTPTDLSSSVTFRCTSKNNEGYLNSSVRWIPTVPSKCFVFKLNKVCYYEGRHNSLN